MQKKTIKNPVAKHMEQFNRPVTIPDKKKEEKRGKTKHKQDYKGED